MKQLVEYLNGDRIIPGSNFLSGENRSFMFGDGVFETVRINDHKPLFWRDHVERLLFAMDRLMLEHPADDFENMVIKTQERLASE